MKIRPKPDFLIAGPGVVTSPDGTADAPEAVALAMIQAGVAEAVAGHPRPETAEAPPSGETAEKPAPKAKGK